MQVVVKTLIVCLLILFTNGCSSSKQECVPVVKLIKPAKVEIDEAKIVQCRSNDVMENTRCVLMNYLSVKKERDQLRSVIDGITE